MGNNKQNINSTEHLLSYLSRTSNLPFINIVSHNTSTGEIEKMIHSFPWIYLCGCDEISKKIFKISAPFISSPLRRIINISLTSGIFQNRLKYSIKITLHRKGDKINVINYRQFHF